MIAAKQEKVLVFTQFREVTAPLAAFLGSVFGRPGLVLHGETPVRSRQELVRRFQEDENVGFFVLSLKAGGSGLNLTAASHVVHFDRWWNPAVENQATDRAFRIGQKKNVLVHKFVCRGTVEEKIDQLIESKRQLSQDLLEGGAELLLTEMKDEELLKLVALDINKALQGDVSYVLRVRMETLCVRGRAAAEGRAAKWRSSRRKATPSRRWSSKAAPSPRPSGARPGATTWSATAISRTGCRAAAPMCATVRWWIFRSAAAKSRPGQRLGDLQGGGEGRRRFRRSDGSPSATDCAGAIDSLVELLQGRFSKGVMERLCRQGSGLFPSPDEIKLSCSCPDWASMCKHVAAVLYGIGARLDQQPELLFRLHKVDEKALIAKAGKGLPLGEKAPAPEKTLGGEDLSAIFGLEMAQAAAAPAPVPEPKPGPKHPQKRARKKTKVKAVRRQPPESPSN